MVVLVALRRRAMVVLLADVEFAPDDRFDAGSFGSAIEMPRAKDVAMIGHGDRLHSLLLHPRHELFRLASAVQQREMRVEVKVGEFRHFVSYILMAKTGIS